MTPRPCTMTDVARRVGVHPATVSRALRDDPRITAAQRALIRRTAQELGYRTNPLIAALMSARRARHGTAYQATLACLTKYPPERAPDFHANFGQLVVGARERATAQGYRLEEFNLAADGFTPRRVTEILLNRNIHGLLVAPLHSVHEGVALDWSQFSTIAIGYSLTDVAVHRVAHNHSAGLADAARHCRAAGRERLGLVLQRRVHEKVQRRWVAASLLDQSEQPVRHRVPPLLFDELDEARFAAWFRRHRPDVVLGVNIYEILEWLKHLGQAVPHDVSVVSLDRRPRDRGIAGIDQDYPDWGANAADMLISTLHRNERGLPAKPLTLLVDGLWLDGRTLGPPGRRLNPIASHLKTRPVPSK